MPERSIGFVAFALLLVASAGAPAARAADAARPNVVFILADDLGYTDVAAYGSQYYETPNIDRLAAEGVRFTNGYACGPNCQPTRAAIMSGQYGPRTGVYTVGGIDRFDWSARPLRPVDNVTSLPADKVTIAQTMRNAGYATAMFGKWHLGEKDGYHPGRRGFDEAIVSNGRHFDFVTNPKTDYPPGTYLADFLTDKAEGFIRENDGKPFFLYLPHFGVHSPYRAKEELVERFKAKPRAGGHHDPVYAAMLYSVDQSVGRIVALLDELKLADNTLVIFSSDNGGVGGYAREGIKKNKEDVTDNAPLRGGKGSLYEGGIRVPYIVRWPGKAAAGTTCDEPINCVDLYPTLVELAGAKPPPAADQPLDGVSYASLLRNGSGSGASGGGSQGTLGRDAIYWHFPGYLGAGEAGWRTTPVSVVRAGDFKLMEFLEDGRLELYNLREDVGEKNNLAQQMPDRAKALHAQLVAWRQSVGAKLPAKNDQQGKPADQPAKKKKKGKGGGKGKKNADN